MRNHVTKINLEIDLLRNWFDHPISKMILEELMYRSAREQSDFLAMPLNAEPYTIERKLFKLSGKAELTKQITEFEWIKSILLEDRVKWTK